MKDPRLNDLFARYRASGDAAYLGRAFDEAAPGLLRIARRLSKDSAAAEDLLQETFLAAIEHAAAWDESRPVGPWLIGILTNRAHTARRRRSRDVPSDMTESRQPAPPEHDLQGAELESAVREALQVLPEGERSVVGARLFEGLTGPEIAERFGISSGLSRVRLHRGLQRLRAALPSGISPGAGGLTLPGATLARVRAAVLAEATQAAGGGPAAPVAAGGYLAVLKFAGVAAALVLVLIGARALWQPDELTPPETDETTAVAEAAMAAPKGTAGGEPPADAGGRTPVVASSSEDAPGPAEGVAVAALILNGATGEPMTGVSVTAGSFQNRGWFWSDLETDSEGRVEFTARPDVESVTIRVKPTDVTGEFSRSVQASELGDLVVVRVLAGGTFEGRVVDLDGNPVPGALVAGWCGPYVRDKDHPHRSTKTDSQGRFRIDHLGPQFHLLSQADGFVSQQGFRGDLEAGHEVSGLDLIMAPAGFVEGRVVDLEGRPVQGVKISSEPGFGSSSWNDQTERPGIRRLFGHWVDAVSDEDGEFQAGPLPVAESSLDFSAPAFLWHRERCSPGSSPHVVTLDPGLSLIGEVTLPDGSPAAGASVIVGPGVRDPKSVRGRWTTDAQGRFRADGFTPPTGGLYEAPPFVFVSMPGYSIALAQPVEPSRRPEERVARIQLVPEQTISGRVVSPDGTPVPNVRLKVESERVYDAEADWGHPPTWEWKFRVDEVRSEADGRFTFGQLGSGDHKVVAWESGDPNRRVSAHTVAGGDPIEIVLDSAVLDGRVLEGVVRSAVSGEPIVDFKVIPMVDGRGTHRVIHAEDGTFRLTGLESWEMGLTVHAEGFASLTLPEVDYSGREGGVDLELWPAKTMRFRIVDENGELHTGQCVVRASDWAGAPIMLPQSKQGASSVYRTFGPEPGRGRIHGLPATQITLHVACEEESADFQVDLSVVGEEELEFILPRTPERPLGAATFLLAYLPGLDPVDASATFAEFQRAFAAGENPALESGLSMEQIDPVVAPVELTMTHESGKRRFRFTAKVLPDGQLEVEDFSDDLRELASGSRHWGKSAPRKTPFAEFTIYDWAGTWDVTATSRAFEPFVGKVTIEAPPSGEGEGNRIRFPEPRFIKVKRR